MTLEKRRNLIKRLGLVGAAVALGITSVEARGRQGGGRPNRPGRPGNGGNQGGNNGGNTGGTQTELTQEQKDIVLYMYQEEKVARDVYSTLGRVYPSENTFANIQLSEQKHIDAVEVLCVKYNVDISEVNEDVIGEFVLPELQELYDVMVARGEESLLDALTVGKEIEEKDIIDLVAAAEGMPSDVQNVFMNLKEGSENHLRAFNRAIQRASR